MLTHPNQAGSHNFCTSRKLNLSKSPIKLLLVDRPIADCCRWYVALIDNNVYLSTNLFEHFEVELRVALACRLLDNNNNNN
jgi:hypothetical protein